MTSDIVPSQLTDNAVLQLRDQRLVQSTRPFRARGCRVIRCHRCLLPRIHCLCHSFSATIAGSTFCLLMYDTEPLKPSNTGRLIADILPDTKAFLWSRTNIDPQLLALLSNPDYQPYIIFPAAYALPERVVTGVEKQSTKRPLFIILDGTWTEARKMFRKSPYLDRFPVLSIDNDQNSNYQLREASRKEQLCTAEVAIQILSQTGEQHASESLNRYFADFRQRYLAGKANRSLESFIAFSASESDKS
ncbi:tRNA-uridine aminocarboxypropyltransferase [Limnobaculum parvum]|uniref:tRNA-uridine aminocarboxypropyltransferase n=1 Tax=Limnobaculum parvum TaxID=2172103 RepID=A0A2Y9U1V4_9GAMM|nr:tRNA-uridine aminocarboxypropyltransferase [Limnobaculum parvum]AWH89524.1 DTW domain-containing protein [Limnobaculum parvum]